MLSVVTLPRFFSCMAVQDMYCSVVCIHILIFLHITCSCETDGLLLMSKPGVLFQFVCILTCMQNLFCESTSMVIVITVLVIFICPLDFDLLSLLFSCDFFFFFFLSSFFPCFSSNFVYFEIAFTYHYILFCIFSMEVCDVVMCDWEVNIIVSAFALDNINYILFEMLCCVIHYFVQCVKKPILVGVMKKFCCCFVYVLFLFCFLSVSPCVWCCCLFVCFGGEGGMGTFCVCFFFGGGGVKFYPSR